MMHRLAVTIKLSFRKNCLLQVVHVSWPERRFYV